MTLTSLLEARIVEDPVVDRLIALALEEDLSERGDVTGRIVPEGKSARGVIVAREAGVLCGLDLAREVFRRVDAGVVFEAKAADGEALSPGQAVARLSGPGRGILAGERTALNFLQRMSGMASLTRRYADVLEGSGAKVYDTRKTIPGWRLLSKYAVAVGGGASHRMGLYDQVLIKDNHLALFGGEAGLAEAIAASRNTAPEGTPIEVEVTTIEGAGAAAAAGADIIMLDNMSPELMARAVALIVERAERRPAIEASGGITLAGLRAVADSGVDRISVGALTHSATALDLALDLDLT